MYEEIIDIDLWTALFTFINMIITFLVLRALLFKPVKKMIDDRQKEIDDLYADAAKQREDAEAEAAEYKNRIADVNKERDDIIRDATSRAEKREHEIIDDAKANAVRIMQKAQSDIAQEKKKALNEAKNDISSLALELAEKVVDKELNKEDHEALIEDFIVHIGDEA